MADEPLSAAEIKVLTGKPARPRASGLDPGTASRLDAIHERAARGFAAELSTLLRRAVRVRHSKAESVSAAEYSTRFELKTYHRRIAAAPLADPWLLNISSATLNSIVDCMLGGGRDARAQIRRPPTDIELRLIGRAVALLLAALRSAWLNTSALELSLIHEESPGAAPEKPQGGTVICTQFVLEFGGAHGELNLSMPAKGVCDLLVSPSGRRDLQESQPVGDRVPETIELVACLAEAEITPEEVANLAVGDIITTEQSAAAPIALSHDGKLKFHAHVGSRRGYKAVEIDRVLANKRDPDPHAAD